MSVKRLDDRLKRTVRRDDIVQAWSPQKLEETQRVYEYLYALNEQFLDFFQENPYGIVQFGDSNFPNPSDKNKIRKMFRLVDSMQRCLNRIKEQ